MGMERVQQSPTDPAFVQNPYPFYDKIRALGEVVWWDEYDLPVTAHHDLISSLLRDKRLGRAPLAPLEHAPDLAPFYEIEAHSMLELEPPRHTKLRAQVLRAFTSRAIQSLRPQIAALAHELIEAFPTGPFDLLPAYATPLPALTITRLMGLPDEDAPQLVAWSNSMVKMYQAKRTRDDEQEAIQACKEFTAYLDDIFTASRNGLIAALLQNTELTPEERRTTCILLLNAGHEATVHTLGNAIKTLLETGLRPSDAPGFTEECIRHDPPLHLFTRYIYDDLEIAGRGFERGDQIGLLLAAGNHDPTAFPEPTRFNPHRPAKPTNLSFGAGIHFCIGAPLARMEIEIALNTLFTRCPKLALHRKPEFANLYHFRGLKELLVTT